jgi:hypothetical protein
MSLLPSEAVMGGWNVGSNDTSGGVISYADWPGWGENRAIVDEFRR